MDGDQLDACLLGTLGDIRGVQRILVPAEAHLQRDRDIDSLHGRLDQRQGVIGIAHQRRAGIAADHLLGRAAHVDLDDIGACIGGLPPNWNSTNR